MRCKYKDMSWKGFYEGIQSLADNVLFVPYNALRALQNESWLLANIFSWILLLIGASAFVYWCLQLKKFNENTESTYTYKSDL